LRCPGSNRMLRHIEMQAPCADHGIKSHSAYRSSFVDVEYRWHPLHGKRVRLVRRTVQGGTAVVHVDTGSEVSRELPAWMVDASICQGMELGPPQVSLAALNELRAVLRMDATSLNKTPTSVSSLDKEGGSGETAAKNIQPAAGAVTGVHNDDKSTRRKGTGGSDQSPRRSAAGSTRRGEPRGNGGPQ
jgi:hypothetical protein